MTAVGWVLIAMAHTMTPSALESGIFSNQEFATEASCQAAASWIKDRGKKYLDVVCLPKGDAAQ